MYTVIKGFLKGILEHLRLLLLDDICQDPQSQLAHVKIASATRDYYVSKLSADEIRQHTYIPKKC